MDILLFKNTGAVALEVSDLGIYLEAGEETDLLLNYRNEDIVESTDIQTAMAGTGQVTLDQGSGAVTITYTQLIDYLTALTKFDKIDFAYVSGKDDDTDVTGAELERLTNGGDASSGTALHNHDTRYYTKTQLNNSNAGTVAIHWDNITNAPQFGALSWKEPVDRTDTSYGSGTVLPVTGNIVNDARMVADDGDGKPAQYVCVATSGAWSDQWVKIADIDWGASNSISVTPSGNLASTNVQSALYELQGDIDNIVNGTLDITHSLNDAYDDGSVVTVDTTDVDFQLSSGRSFIVSSGATQSLKVTGTTTQINGSLDVNGGAITLDATSASNLSVTGNTLTLSTLTSGNISISSASALTFKDQFLSSPIALSQTGTTGLVGYTATSIIGALNEVRSLASGADTLDEVYDGPTGGGSGRVITVDSGSVKLDATSATYAPLELTQQTAAPTSGLAAGQIAFINGHLYNYDGTRAKWISVDEQRYDWADQAANGKYLKVGSALGTEVGFKIPLNAVITKVTARVTGGNLTKEIQIRKNGLPASIKTFNLTAGEYTSTNDNINVTAGDYIQAYVSGSGAAIHDPVVSVYLAWRV